MLDAIRQWTGSDELGRYYVVAGAESLVTGDARRLRGADLVEDRVRLFRCELLSFV